MRFRRLAHRNEEALRTEAETGGPTERSTADDAGTHDLDAREADAVDVAPVEPVEPSTSDSAPAEPNADAAELAPGIPASEEARRAATESPETAAWGAVAAEVAEGDPDVDGVDAPLGSDVRSAASLLSAEAAADAIVGQLGATAGTEVDATSRPVAQGELSPSRAPVVFWPGPTAERADDPADDPAAEGRPADLRFARLHLRAGQYALARAELEALAGRGPLDEPGLLDLAEIRWRTGDLAGAGAAANALLARGSESLLALVIAAEAVASVGRPGEARRLSTRALEVADGPLEPLFAGMPRSTIWPANPEEPPIHAAQAPRRRGRNRTADTAGAPSTASEAFAGGRAALARGDATRAALLLGVAIRLAPEFAEDVLRAVTGRDDQPLLALVRGDALRLLGREAEALEAFDRARGRARGSGGVSERPPAPGLFDADLALADDDEA